MDLQFQQPNNKQRPLLLTILCVLSFAGSGIGATGSFFTYFFYDTIMEAIASGEQLSGSMNLEMLTAISRTYFILTGMLMALSFTGVYHMWHLRRSGFHIYAIAQIMMLIIASVYVHKPLGLSPMPDLLLATVFILLYLRFRNIMA